MTPRASLQSDANKLAKLRRHLSRVSFWSTTISSTMSISMSATMSAPLSKCLPPCLFFYHDESVRIKSLLGFVRFTAQICEILGTSTRLTRSKTLVQSNDDQFKLNQLICTCTIYNMKVHFGKKRKKVIY